MTEGKEKHLGERADVCDVCEKPLDGVKAAVSREFLGKVFTFCSDACLKEYLEDPGKFAEFEEEE